MKPQLLRTLARWATPVVVSAIIILAWVPGNERPHTGLTGQTEHALAYALAAAGVVVGFPRRRLFTGISFVVLAGVLEIGQIWIPGRTSQIIDFIASGVGASAGLIISDTLVNRWVMQKLAKLPAP